MSPYWESQLNPVRQGVNSLGSAIVMAPRIRQQVALMQARQQADQAQAAEAASRGGLLDTQNQRAQLQLAQAMALANRFKQPGAITTDKDGNMVIDKGAIADVASAIGGMGTGANDAANGLANIFKSANAPVQAGLDRTSKESIAAAANAERAGRPVVVPNGATLMAPGGAPLGSGGVTLNPGQQRFAPVSLAGALSQPPASAAADQPPGENDATDAGAPMAALSMQTPVAMVPPKGTPAATMPPGVQAEVFKALLQNEGGGTNTQTALNGLQAAMATANAPAAAPATAASSTVQPPTGPLTMSGIPVAHGQWLAAHPTPANVASFEATYGKGSAAQFLNSQ
jgi:hypothetical protein